VVGALVFSVLSNLVDNAVTFTYHGIVCKSKNMPTHKVHKESLVCTRKVCQDFAAMMTWLFQQENASGWL
jgi:hypothetical protein